MYHIIEFTKGDNVIINSKSSLIKLLETCRDSHKLWTRKARRNRHQSLGSQAWNIKVIKEYQDAINFIKNNLRRQT
jgi:hypothetical protein